MSGVLLLLPVVGLVPVPVLPTDGLLLPQTSPFLFCCCSEVNSFLSGPALAPYYHTSVLLQTFLLGDLLHCTRARDSHAAKSTKRVERAVKGSQGTLPPQSTWLHHKCLLMCASTALRHESVKLSIFFFSQAGTQQAAASLSGSCSALVSA